MKKNYYKINSLNFSFIKYGFFTKNGGCSKKNYKSLNCSYSNNDNKNNVKKNISIALDKLKLTNKKIKFVKQIHSSKIINVNDDNFNKIHEGDGIITKNKNIALAILTADCVPIFIFDKKKKMICCLHSGWKGALYNIVEKGIKIFNKNKINNKDIIVIIGPCLSKKNFEVSLNFKNKFIKKDSRYSFYFKCKNKKKDIFDMRGIINFQFKKLGVKNLYNIRKDTYSNDSTFFSHRRATHNKKLSTGRMINVISFK